MSNREFDFYSEQAFTERESALEKLLALPSFQRAVESDDWPLIRLLCHKGHPIMGFQMEVITDDFGDGDPVRSFNLAPRWLDQQTGRIASDSAPDVMYECPGGAPESPDDRGLRPAGDYESCGDFFVPERRGQITCKRHGSTMENRPGEARATFVCWTCSTAYDRRALFREGETITDGHIAKFESLSKQRPIVVRGITLLNLYVTALVRGKRSMRVQ